jgi:hypothetical protein
MTEYRWKNGGLCFKSSLPNAKWRPCSLGQTIFYLKGKIRSTARKLATNHDVSAIDLLELIGEHDASA